jgi:polygalacturonase
LYTNQSGVFNIYDYDTARPPDPTGVNDSSYAINAAATVAGSNGGGVVFVPPGNYQIQYTIVLPNNVQLVGSDQSDTSITAKPGLMWSSTVATNTTVMVTNSSNPPIGTGGVQTGVGVKLARFRGQFLIRHQAA